MTADHITHMTLINDDYFSALEIFFNLFALMSSRARMQISQLWISKLWKASIALA